MAEPILFEFSNPSTWIPSLAAGGLGLYWVVRSFRRDSRNDKQEKQVDAAVTQIIETLRVEVTRLTDRVTKLENEVVRCHEERADLLAQLEASNFTANQPRLL